MGDEERPGPGQVLLKLPAGSRVLLAHVLFARDCDCIVAEGDSVLLDPLVLEVQYVTPSHELHHQIFDLLKKQLLHACVHRVESLDGPGGMSVASEDEALWGTSSVEEMQVRIDAQNKALRELLDADGKNSPPDIFDEFPDEDPTSAEDVVGLLFTELKFPGYDD